MSTDSGPDPRPGKSRRGATRRAPAGISRGLREEITRSARQIRRAHKAELDDALVADRAGRLFRSMIRPESRSLAGSNRSANGVEALADQVAGLLNDAIRAGTRWLDAFAPSPRETVEGVETAASAARAPETPPANAEEVMLRGLLRRFMPMLVATLNQGGDGYTLAKTVIALFGRRPYDQACGLGKDRLVQLVKTEPDLWAQVAPVEHKFARFLEEFTSYDAWVEQQARRAADPEAPAGA